MAAATVTLDSALGTVFQPRGHGLWLIPVDITTELATTQIDDAADVTQLFLFPDPAYLWDLDVLVVDDLDTNATPTLVWDLDIDDGTTSTTIINNSTVGQSAGTDALDSLPTTRGMSCAGAYLELTIVTAAATAAAGTFRVSFTYTTGFPGIYTAVAS